MVNSTYCKEHDAIGCDLHQPRQTINGHDKTKELLLAYFKVHDILSDLMERGVLTEAMIPDDYQALLVGLEAAAILGVDPNIRKMMREHSVQTEAK